MPPQQFVQVNLPQPEKGNALAIAALVLGILAALACWMPFVGLVAIPIGVLGLVLGIIALTLAIATKRRGIAPASVGTALCVLAMIGSVAITGMASRGLADALKDANKPRPVPVAAPVEPIVPNAGPAGPRPVAAVPPVVPAKPAPPPEPDAVDYPNPAQLGNVQVKLLQVVRGPVPLEDKLAFRKEERHGQSKDKLLSIYLEVTNLNDGRKLDYSSFAGRGFGTSNAQLSDDLRNNYRRINFGISTAPEGRTEAESIYPGKAIGDHLVFELPVDKASHLILELPAEHVGIANGMFRFKIPVAAVERRD